MSVVVHVQAPTWPNVLSLHSPLGTACELLTLIRACTMLILLVEDSVSDVFLFRALLKEQGLSPQLVIASDGDLACSMIEQMVSQAAPCPDLIVLDLNLEMGEPPPVQNSEPAMWVRARQYTGRIVTITNDKIFETPVFNYTREFPFIWEEILVPITYKTDMKRAEQIILEAVRGHTTKISDIGETFLAELERRYFVQRSEFEPRVFVRLTDNWVELSVRFIARDHGIRELKDKISREMLERFNDAGIGIASGTYDVVGIPPISVKLESAVPPVG